MKIGFFYSIFSVDQIEMSISYILCLVKNIDTLKRVREKSKVYGDVVDIVINCDEFTKKIIEDVCKNEDVDSSWVKYHIHRRNNGLRGMFWRFESIFSDEYDVTVNAEGDYEVSNYLKRLEYFVQRQYPLMIFDVRQFNINKNSIVGGMFFVHPKLIKQEVKDKIRRILPLFDHIDDIDYGVDELYLREFLIKNFSNERILVIADHKHNIFQHIEDLEKEKEHLRAVFKKSDVADINWFEGHLKKCTGRYDAEQKKNLKHLNTNENVYILGNNKYTINPPLRIDRSEFCQNYLLNLIKDLI